MPVDKFGHTDSGSTQRTIAGGVTLTQANNTFLRRDGTIAATGNLDMGGNSIEGLSTTYNPSEDNHLTNKKYVDERDDSKVSKTGDTMTGNLFLHFGSANVRTMGSRDLRENKQFVFLLGNTSNKIQCRVNRPITLQSTDGFLCRQGDHDIMRFGSALGRRVESFQDIVMNGKYIVDLHDPAEAQDSATKKYVDNSLKKCHVGYIPNLKDNASRTGFHVISSSHTHGHEAYKAFNHDEEEDGAWIHGDGVIAWIQIKCPEPVII